jgi:PPK2 family polyphosphate:nucleotide phosphotransferase
MNVIIEATFLSKKELMQTTKAISKDLTVDINMCLIRPRTHVRLRQFDADYGKMEIGKMEQARAQLADLTNRISHLQYKLFADKSQALLIILQGIDTSGKSSTIRHVMEAFNPQSCRVVSFRAPTTEEIGHDYLWRVHKELPSKGEIAIFNRSHYEDIIEVRVHNTIPTSIWSQRYRQINDFEQYLSENSIKIIKLFLHIGRDEQKKRLESRLKDPKKRWKITEKDIQELKHWDEYLKAYEDVLNRCSLSWAPWYIIPSNFKWFRNIVVATIIVHALESMNLSFPKPKVDISKMTIV